MDENKKENCMNPEPEDTKNASELDTPDSNGTPINEEQPALDGVEEASAPEASDETESTVKAAEDSEDEFEKKINALMDEAQEDAVEQELAEIASQPVEDGGKKNKKEKKSHKKFWRIFSIVLVAVLVFCGAAYLFIDPTTAVTVGKNRISAMEFEYYYKSNVSDFSSNYGSYYSLDTSKDLSKQECPLKNEDGSSIGTWHDYFMEQTKNQLTMYYTFYDEAKANKETLSSDDTKEIEENVKEIKDAAATAGQSMPEYCLENYGFKMNERTLLKIFRVNTLAANYYNNKFSPSKDYTEQELQEYYNKNKDDMDSVALRWFVISIDTEQEKGDAQAKAKANKMLSEITDEAAFAAKAKEYASKEEKDNYAKDSATLIPSLTKAEAEQGLPEEAIEWLFSRQRKAGDKTVVTDGSGYYVLYLVHPLQKQETPQVDMRHILIEPETDSGASATSAQKKAARTKAESLYKQWVDGGKSLDTFAKLAKENSKDTGSSSNGGLYEGVNSGQFVTELNDWLFDSARKPGDSGVVDTQYGSHVVYYEKQGKPTWMADAKTALDKEAKDKATEELMEKTKYKINKIGVKFVDFSLQS